MRQGSYKVVKVNIDEEPQLAQTYNVQSIPLVGLFRDGRLERQSLGAKPRAELESALGMLVKASKRLHERGGGLALARPQPGIARLLRMVGLARVLPSYPSIDAAAAALTGASPRAAP